MSDPTAGKGGVRATEGPARVEEALRSRNLEARIERFPAGTATATDAAAAVGCELGQIVKTLIFSAGGRPTVVLAAGDRRIDTAALARLLGTPRKQLRLAPADEVLALTGFEVGGVPPMGLPGTWDVVADESLGRFRRVWAAAGASDAVFAIDTDTLIATTGAQRAAIASARA